jgi:hypothetical protein
VKKTHNFLQDFFEEFFFQSNVLTMISSKRRSTSILKSFSKNRTYLVSSGKAKISFEMNDMIN